MAPEFSLKTVGVSVLFVGMCFVTVYGQTKNAVPKLSFSSREVSAVSAGTNYSYAFFASDPANNFIHYHVPLLPVWLHFDKKKNVLSGSTRIAGQYPIHIIATNGKDTVHQHFMLTVCNSQTTKILCLGNSITNGTGKYNSYRRALWQLLHQGNYNFDFIGSWSKHSEGREMPDPDFDLDHEGHSGWTFADIFTPPTWDNTRGNINEWLKNYSPDITLLELGTNDVFHCRLLSEIVTDLTRLLQTLRQKNEHVVIVLAQIPPLGQQWAGKKLCGDSSSYDQRIRSLNSELARFALVNSTKESPVLITDQYTGVVTGTDLYDDIHPNEKGEKLMAERWFKVIHKLVNKL